jgi:hypothetical protein
LGDSTVLQDAGAGFLSFLVQILQGFVLVVFLVNSRHASCDLMAVDTDAVATSDSDDLFFPVSMQYVISGVLAGAKFCQ